MGRPKFTETGTFGSRPVLKLGPDVTPQKKRVEPKNNGVICICCGKKYMSQANNFYQSKSPLFVSNNGRLPWCKHCVWEYTKMLMEAFGDVEKAIEHACMMFDWYYNPEAAQYAIRSGKENLISAYFIKIMMPQMQKKGTTYADTIRDGTSTRILSLEHIPKVEAPVSQEPDDDVTEPVETQPELVISPETVKFFGYGYQPEEYEYLDNQYEDWVERYECKTKAQEELFKNLSIAQLVIQRVQKNGTTKEITDAMKTFQDLLGTANLKPNQNVDVPGSDQLTFGVLIKKLEQERPVSEPLEEWEDVDGIKKDIETFFLGHLCNLVHVQNDYEEEYREEMKKYTVTPPVYEEDDDGGETSLLDKYSTRSNSKEEEDAEPQE